VETREKAFAAVAAIGLAIGIVALVIAISAKNDEQSHAELTQQGQQELDEKADALKAELSKESAATGAAGNQAKKANRKARAARQETSSLSSEVDDLKQQVDDLKSENTSLSNKLDQQVTSLKGDVKALRKGKANK
jgi:chromosome segregation ATPase